MPRTSPEHMLCACNSSSLPSEVRDTTGVRVFFEHSLLDEVLWLLSPRRWGTDCLRKLKCEALKAGGHLWCGNGSQAYWLRRWPNTLRAWSEMSGPGCHFPPFPSMPNHFFPVRAPAGFGTSSLMTVRRYFLDDF